MDTPYFLIQTEIIDKLVHDITSALRKRWPNGIIGYSFKTNNLPWLIKYFKNKGLMAEVVSSDEYQLAKLLNYDTQDIIFNGPVKNKNDFINAIENGAIVNIDSKRELSWLLECNRDKLKSSKIGLRVNFCIEEYCPGESQCGVEDGRFGFSYETGELKNAIDYLDSNSIKISGLHIHCSSKTRSINIYKNISRMAATIANEYNLSLEYIDIGGGYFGGMPNKPSFDEYFENIYNIFSNSPLLKKVNLIIEPGMSVIGAGIDYVSTVVDIKETRNNNFVLIDGSRIHIDPLMRKSGYLFEIAGKTTSEVSEKNQILCGFTCMEADRLCKFSCPDINIGDIVTFKKVGAYTMGLSPQFIEFYPAVYANIDGKYTLVRNKNTAKNFIENNLN